MKRILVVDDNSVSLSLAKNMLSDKYSVYAVLSGEQALKFLSKKEADLILLDINMPNMSGLETLKCIKENSETKDIPIIFLTSENDPETERICFEMGALDFIIKPFQKATLRSRVGRILELLALQNNLKEQLVAKTKQIARLSLKSMMIIANTVDKKDPLAAKHSTHVAWYAVEIAKKMGWDSDDVYNIQNLALVHDIGKIGVADDILNKRGPLTSDEYESVKKHTLMGKNILQDLTVIKKAAEVAETHHERYDGKGYPNGLSGDNIPIESRIIAVADAFDAMTSDRSFRKRLSEKQLKEEFEKGRGTQFDPKITDIALSIIDEGIAIPDENETENESDIVMESSRILQKVLQEYANEVKYEAQKDVLTGLWNRGHASDVINEYLSDKRHFGCFFMIDMDGFKNINDTYGHIVGDKFIQIFARTLTDELREEDIICRIGGDEFIVFIKGTGARSIAGAKAADILKALDKNLQKPDGTGSVTSSIGIAMAPEDGSDFNTLYNKADKALYYVKSNGKNSYHYFSEESERSDNTKKNAHIDMEYLRQFIMNSEEMRAKYPIEYEGLKRIYQFIARVIRRTSNPIQALLFTLSTKEGEVPSLDLLSNGLFCLKNAVTTAIKSGDVATNYSSSQYIVLLVDSTQANCYLVAEHIRKLFNDNLVSEEIDINYDVDEIPVEEHSRLLSLKFDKETDKEKIKTTKVNKDMKRRIDDK